MSAPQPDLITMLAEMAVDGARAVRIVTNAMAADDAIIQLVTSALPDPAKPPSSMAAATAAGMAIDTAVDILAAAVPRIALLARVHTALSRSVRRTVALHRRLQSGWTGTRSADTRAAMQKRQVKTAIAKRIRETTDDEPAERLFDDLNEQLDAPGFDEEIATTSVEAVIERIATDIGLALSAAATCAPAQAAAASAAAAALALAPTPPPDTG